MKKAIKAIVGIALALSFAVVPSAINSGDASSSSSITTVSANTGISKVYAGTIKVRSGGWTDVYEVYNVYYCGKYQGQQKFWLYRY